MTTKKKQSKFEYSRTSTEIWAVGGSEITLDEDTDEEGSFSLSIESSMTLLELSELRDMLTEVISEIKSRRGMGEAP